jgi:hypothetical protein
VGSGFRVQGSGFRVQGKEKNKSEARNPKQIPNPNERNSKHEPRLPRRERHEDHEAETVLLTMLLVRSQYSETTTPRLVNHSTS